MIKGLKKFLEENISPLEFVEGILPGEIKVSNGTGEKLIVKYKYNTNSGAKLIAKSGTSIQEIFVVTRYPDKLKDVLRDLEVE
jgi:hypothetical protein